jgi:beta-lactam-binding protein with PASTA domain
MALNLPNLLTNVVVARQQGVTDQPTQFRLGLIGGLFGSFTTGLIMTTVLARREAEAAAADDTGTPTTPPSEITLLEMPDVTGGTLEEAKLTLAQFGLDPDEITEVPIETISTLKDIVTKQVPEPKSAVSDGSEVTLTVSKGFRMPEVIGQEFEKARADLENRIKGLTVRKAEDSSDDENKGKVIGQEPSRGTVVTGDEVTLTVGLGRSATVKMPWDLIGKKYEAAAKVLLREDPFKEVNLSVDRDDVDDLEEEGLVVNHKPGPGEPVASGGIVTLYVSRGPENAPE